MIGNEAGIVEIVLQASRPNESERNNVAILLGTFNGERHLEAQLTSIAKQSHKDWTLWVSDDGSSDRTSEILRHFAIAHPDRQIHLLEGPRKGFALNYISLLRHPEIKARYIAFCDQDDIWLEHHLEAAIRQLAPLGDATPALFCARTAYIDADGSPMGESRKIPVSYQFSNALAQNLCSGNTMLMNIAARRLLRDFASENVSAHDWLATLLVSGVGGSIVYDREIHVLYRQHAGNSMGENRSLRAHWRRLRQLKDGTLRRWTDLNVAALAAAESVLTPENLDVLRTFAAARQGPPWTRLTSIRVSGVRRTDRISDTAYKLALLCNLV
ncbi:MAG: glycosyltransferase family 2 protein [Ramlibacter sp.]|nr:glycosyltransferase family 2 protein [Ramlibacter sp.]